MRKFFALAAACVCLCLPVFAAEGVSSANIHKTEYEYTRYGFVVTSNLYENAGALERVEYTDKKVVVEKYDYEGNFVSAIKEITPPLSIFGGFYSGEKYNYLVFGEYNLNDDSSAEVVRLQKYTKDWSLLKECSIYGANTYIPFDAGSARMTEAGGKLYLYTCHEMFKSSDGYHHQSNMQFIIDIDSFESPSNPYSPYASHSFNQFIQTDGSYIYAIDHGDAYPRSVVMSRYSAGKLSYSDVTRSTVLAIVGDTGNNTTGVAVGGFELGKNNALVAGNTVVQDISTFSSDTQRNIFIGIAPKDMSTPSIKMLTNYTKDNGVSVRNPYLIKLSGSEFLVMWEENDGSTYKTKAVKIDENANIISQTEKKTPLSGCKPILAGDGRVYWYVTDNTSPILYWLDPKTYESQKTVEEDWTYDESTATLTIGGKGFMPSGPLPWAAHNADVKNLVIKDGVGSVSESAFADCAKLESVTLADSVGLVGASSFKGCTSLKSITLPKKATSIGDSTFEGCTALKSIKINGNVTQIGTKAFSGCSALESINIPNTVTSFGTYAFDGCSALLAINIPSGMTGIPMYCFRNCAALKAVSLPDSITSIGFCSFEGCAALESVDMPKTLNSIGGGAFEDCAALKSIVIPTGVKSIGGDTFRNDKALVKVTFPDTLTSIGTSAFYHCEALVEADIPDSVQSLGAWAFGNCKLTSVNIPYGITALNSGVFAYCPIEEVEIPNTVKTIAYGAFFASRLKTVTIPDSVESLGNMAFYGSSMRALIIPDSVTTFGDEAFGYFGYSEYIYCYKGSQTESVVTERGVNYKYIGDMDGDKELTDTDAKTMLQYADGSKTVKSGDYDTAAKLDYDLDGEFTVLDTIKMLNYMK